MAPTDMTAVRPGRVASPPPRKSLSGKPSPHENLSKENASTNWTVEECKQPEKPAVSQEQARPAVDSADTARLSNLPGQWVRGVAAMALLTSLLALTSLLVLVPATQGSGRWQDRLWSSGEGGSSLAVFALATFVAGAVGGGVLAMGMKDEGYVAFAAALMAAMFMSAVFVSTIMAVGTDRRGSREAWILQGPAGVLPSVVVAAAPALVLFGAITIFAGRFLARRQAVEHRQKAM